LTIFRGRTDRHLRGVLSISRDKTGASNMCLQYHDVLSRLPKDSTYPFSCLQFWNIFVLEKFQLCTIFEVVRIIVSAPFWLFFRNEMALQVCLCDATLHHED